MWKINGTLGWKSFILYLQCRLSPAIIAQTFSIRTSNSSAYLQRISSILRLRLHLTNNPEILFQEESTVHVPRRKDVLKGQQIPNSTHPSSPTCGSQSLCPKSLGWRWRLVSLHVRCLAYPHIYKPGTERATRLEFFRWVKNMGHRCLRVFDVNHEVSN